MRNDARIAVVIPAFNEARAIARVIADIPKWVDQIIVADNASTDATAAIAEAAGALVVHESEPGYGAACQAALANVAGADIIVFVDGDYSDHAEDLAQLVDPIIAGRCDMVIASRALGDPEPGSLTLQQRFGNWLATRLIRLIWGVAYTDLGPFRAIRNSALQQLQMRDRNYGWTVEMQVRAAEIGLAVQEVPARYRRRIGTSKISGTITGTVRAGTKILTVIARHALAARRHTR